ncbi:MAG: ABC transporter ATP-binding protein [Candidatus Azobacteroides sp.]|nr:ABC transporter ATP-binding protein [Candidatus Azobacteroides sp.]
MSDAALYTTELSIGYTHNKQRKYIRKNLNLSVYPKDLIAIIGPNGCGKSTLLKTLGGLILPLEGNIRIGKQDIQKASNQEKAKLISFVLTDAIQANGLSVRDLISMGRFPYTNWLGNLSEKDKEKIEEAISLIGLEGYEDRSLMKLSDGEKQRVMIAKALVQDTPFIFLDEPTAHLDLNNRIEILSLLRRISEKTGKSVILSTHELDLALKICNRIWLMDNTLGLYDKTPEEIITKDILKNIFPNCLLYFNENGTLEYSI